MRLIDAIEIEYYRSFKKVKIKDLTDLNIFSGKNDVGKSNILVALDSFFNKGQINFVDDYNKEKLAQIRTSSKKKQYIKIIVTLNNINRSKTIPDKIRVTKSWDRYGNLTESTKDDLDVSARNGKIDEAKLVYSRRTLTGLLNKIRYTYIPAVRDEVFFSKLLMMLQETIIQKEEKKNKSFQTKISDFNATLAQLSEQLNSEFRSVSGINTSLSLPDEMSEIFQRLIIHTSLGDEKIPLRLRGDGIRMQYIPTILNYISKHSKFVEIWGFDEPENSCEHTIVQNLAHNFAEKYVAKSQIFCATHSFAFISLCRENTARYRVIKSDDTASAGIAVVTELHDQNLEEELGLLKLNEDLAEVYDKYKSEIDNYAKVKAELNEIYKPVLMFEGNSDRILFGTAFSKLFNSNIDDSYKVIEYKSNGKGDVGSGASTLTQFLRQHADKLHSNFKYFVVYDADKAGTDELDKLKESFAKYDFSNLPGATRFDSRVRIYQHIRKPNIFALCLVAPDHRLDFYDQQTNNYCYISTELLLKDNQIPDDKKYYITKYDTHVFSFKSDDKIKFAKRIERNSDVIDFEGFRATFDLLSLIVSQGN